MRLVRVLAAPVLALTLVLGACTTEEEAAPEDAVRTLAEALVGGAEAPAWQQLEFTAFTVEAAAADYARIVEGMGEVSPAVEVGDVTEEGDSASADLEWTWPLGEGWSYATEVALVRTEGDWQVAWQPSVVEPNLLGETVLEVTRTAPDRGDVLGAGGLPLVTERPVVRVGVDKAVAGAAAVQSARQLARLTEIDAAAYAARVRASGPKAFVEAITYRQDQLPEGLAAIPGARAIGARLPLAPTRDFAAPLLGSVGEVTAEIVAEEPARYRAGDQAGLSGLQKRYDEQLRGTPGASVFAVAPDGARSELVSLPPQDGEPLTLTLDARLQTTAERLLAGVPSDSALVALRPSDGAILAAANGPGNEGYNVATFGQAAPGSTFKVVSSLALLRAGLSPDTTVECPAETVVDGKRFENYDDFPASSLGRIPLREAVAQSCNTAFIQQAAELGPDDLAGAAASLGVGVDHEAGFPAYFGEVPPPASDVEKAADLIGQGKILASPMAMAAVVGSVAAGRTVVPRLVEGVTPQPPAEAAPLTAEEAGLLRGMLRAVVTDGSGRALADVPGPEVIAKTGTAEFERDGRLLTHAWMVAARGDLAVAVYVEEGESGSAVAGPILEEFLRAAG